MNRIAFFIAIASILCFTACDDNADYIDKPETVAQIKLVIPDAEKVSVYSTATESECMIESIWVIEFDKTSKLAVNSQKIDGNDIARNGQAAQLLPQLSFNPTIGNLVVCIANSSRLAPVSVGYNYNNINDQNSMIGFPPKAGVGLGRFHYEVGDPLPMYGEMEWKSDNYTCTMTRAVAKIQVKMGESVSDVTGTFSSDYVKFFGHYIPSSGYIKPKPNDLSGASGTSNFNFIPTQGATDKETTFYIHDYPNSTESPYAHQTLTDNVFDPGRTCIILKHNYLSDTAYYRLDFYDPSTKKFIDIKRNHHYTFVINKVRSKGYRYFAEARENPASNIEYTIKIEDNAQSITSNGQYAIVTSADTIFLENREYGQQAGYGENVGIARYQLPTEMSVLPAGTTNTVGYKLYPNNSFFLNESAGYFANPPLSSLLATNSNINIITTTNFQIAHIYFAVGNIKKTMVIVNKAKWDGVQQPTFVGN